MSCVLCLEVNENSFNFNDPEGINLNARQILEKHFVFCFDVSRTISLARFAAEDRL